jgi:perosamine synthetase
MIPLSVPNLSGNEWKYIKECLDTNWVSSVGSYVNLFEKTVADFCDVRSAIAISNGTLALHISLLLSGVRQGDLVILPNITFVAPANVIKYVEANPVLIDVDETTWQMDLDLLENFLITHTIIKEQQTIHKETGRRIAAILPVHVLGNICDMDRLLGLAQKYQLVIVEDATEALGSYYKDKHAGTFGKFGCLSFNGNKIITTGGGGMVLCNDIELGKKVKHLTTQAKADPNEYYHDEIGYNYRLVNILAAMGVAQMEQLPQFLKRKREIKSKYDDFFSKINGATPQKITENVQSNNWLYTVRLPQQQELRKYLLANNIDVRPFWVPMNRLPAFKKDIHIHVDDVAGRIYNNCLSLPCSTSLTEEEQNTVLRLLKKFYYD